jgi:hypothetical protein
MKFLTCTLFFGMNFCAYLGTFNQTFAAFHVLRLVVAVNVLWWLTGLLNLLTDEKK